MLVQEVVPSELQGSIIDRHIEAHPCPEWLDVGGQLVFITFTAPVPSQRPQFVLSTDLLLTASVI